MSISDLSIHYAFANRVQDHEGEGWEFVCPTCNYHARYHIHSQQGTPQFKILHLGDPQARHTSNHDQVGASDISVDESWLPPKVRQQMEELLKDVDMGDWEAQN